MARKKKQRKLYSPEFKEQAVRLVVEGEEPVAKVARDLGISHSALANWVRQSEERGGYVGGVTPEEREELERLRKEVRVLRQERDILKKSVAFFVRENS